jgi:hypothetical protein
MVPNKSLDEVKLISTLLCDISTMWHGEVFDQRAVSLTVRKIRERTSREGIGFLTKSLPRLGKAVDTALLGELPVDSAQLRLASQPNSKLPKLFGELLNRVFSHDGMVLPTPCVRSIKQIRDLCYLFYKYEVPYSPRQEQAALSTFLQTEEDIAPYDISFSTVADTIDNHISLNDAGKKRQGVLPGPLEVITSPHWRNVIRRARAHLSRVFENFEPRDIVPRHGPGVVSTKERLWGKYFWSNIPDRLANMFPIDAYFYASNGHVCDAVSEIRSLGNREDSARVIFVPKDSRGPRLISAEPLVFQWIQQGLGRAIVSHIERHPLTRDDVHFTDQQPNRTAALLGSTDGRYSTLDLKEASDRVTVGLVRMLFPSSVLPYLLAARSLSTTLPDGRILKLKKFAPMGSALCFPVLALTCWAILRAMYRDADIGYRPNVLVYGDDVIVPTAIAGDAIKHLEAFGLLVNRHKSCVSGFFRESCGMDAYKGHPVTPLRIRKKIPSSPSPDGYSAWIAYANQFWDTQYFKTYELIAGMLLDLYGRIPSKRLGLRVPSLYEVPENKEYYAKRINKDLQKVEYLVYDIASKPLRHRLPGWKMLLRYFTSGTLPSITDVICSTSRREVDHQHWNPTKLETSVDVSSYTARYATKVVKRWR